MAEPETPAYPGETLLFFYDKLVEEPLHLETPSIENLEYLQRQTSGLAIPIYLINAPKGKGETPILSNFLTSWGLN